MPGSRRRTVDGPVLRLAGAVTAVSALVVLGGASSLWLLEADRPTTTVHSWWDALWWSLTTMTTVGYGDHVPVTAGGRLVAACVMVAGVAVLGAVAAVVALAVSQRVAGQEELALEGEAETLEARLEARLDLISSQLARVEALLAPAAGRPDHRDGPAGSA